MLQASCRRAPSNTPACKHTHFAAVSCAHAYILLLILANTRAYTAVVVQLGSFVRVDLAVYQLWHFVVRSCRWHWSACPDDARGGDGDGGRAHSSASVLMHRSLVSQRTCVGIIVHAGYSCARKNMCMHAPANSPQINFQAYAEKMFDGCNPRKLHSISICDWLGFRTTTV